MFCYDILIDISKVKAFANDGMNVTEKLKFEELLGEKMLLPSKRFLLF